MIADCHMHTSFSTDSKARPEEMIERAIALGMKEICITDHYDMDYPRNPRTGEKEFQLDTPAYQAKIRELQERYRDRIQIRFGVELGLQAHLKKQMEEYVRRYDGGVTQIHSRAIQVSGEADEVLYQASLAARERDREKVEPVDLLAGILRADQCAAAQLLQSMDVQREMVQKEMDQLEEIGSEEEQTESRAGGRRIHAGEIRQGYDKSGRRRRF